MSEACCFCCCCCYCCILPAVLVPLFVIGTLDGQAAVAAVASSFQNAADDVVTALGRLEVSEIYNATDDQGNFSICGDTETLVDDSVDMNATYATRCEKNTVKTWSKWIVRVTSTEFIFNRMVELNYYTCIAALICCATQISLAFFTSFPCFRFTGRGSIPILEMVFASYFGLIYLGYLVTVPLFGRPEERIFFPELPHLSPPFPWTEDMLDGGLPIFKVKVVYAIRNSLLLGLLPSLLMMSTVLFLGILFAVPPVCFFMAILFFSMGWLNGLAARIESFVRMRLSDAKINKLPQIKGPITVPWWDGYTRDSFQHMDLPSETLAKALSCNISVSCSIARRSLCRQMLFLMAEVLKILVAVGIPSFLKFIFDIFFLLTALGSFSLMVPALTFELPDLGMAQLRPTYVPEWQGHCRSTTGLGLSLNLIGSTFFAPVIISSDVLSYFYDRVSRLKLLHCALRQLIDAREDLSPPPAVFPLLCGLLQASIQALALAVLFSTALIVNQAAVILVRLVLEMGVPNSDDGNMPEGYPPCTLGLFALSKILGMIAMLVTLIFACRVLSGDVYKDGTYILGAAPRFDWRPACSRLKPTMFMTMLRVCTFNLLLPFLSFGLEENHLKVIHKELKEKRGDLDRAFERYDLSEIGKLESELVKRVKDVKRPIRLETNLAQTGVMKLLQRAADITGNRRVRAALTSGLFMRAADFFQDQIYLQRDVGRQLDLRARGDFHLFDYIRCCSNIESHRSKQCHSFLALLGAPVGRMTNADAIANHLAERCCMWEAQAESVQRATSYVQGLVLFLIPVGGAIAGKGLQLLSEVPGLFTAESEEICQYSFRQEPNPLNPKNPRIVASGWCMASYACAILRFMCLFLTVADSNTDMFWAMAIANSALAIAQAYLERIDDRENKCRIARFLHDREKLQETSSLGKDSPSPETFGVQILNDVADVDDANAQPEEEALLNSDVAYDEVEPEFLCESDEENPSSSSPNKGKKKAKKAQSKAKSKAKPKAKAPKGL